MCTCGYRAELSIVIVGRDVYIHVCQACARTVKNALTEENGPCEYRGIAYLGSAFQG